jgi:thymidylate kinase
MLLTLEGVDGTGKSTLFSRLTRRIRRNLPCGVLQDKEPGGWGFEVASLPTKWNHADQLLALWAAAFHTYDHHTRDGARLGHTLGIALRLIQGGSCTAWHKQQLLCPEIGKPLPDTTMQNPLVARARHALQTQPDLREAVQSMHLRTIIRQVLLHTPESPTLSPLTTGLLFFADHTLASRFAGLQRKSRGTMVVFDRYADSQLAYGRVRGCPGIVERLYRQNLYYPTQTILLTASPEVLEERISGRSKEEQAKQNGKAWNHIDFLIEAQKEYLRLTQEPDDPRDWVVINTDDLTPREVLETAWEQVRRQYDADVYA